MYINANGESMPDSSYMPNQNPYVNMSPGYNSGGFMNPPVPPTLNGDGGYNINQPSMPGYHDINDPYGYGWGQQNNYNPYQQPQQQMYNSGWYNPNYGYNPYYTPYQQQTPYFTGQSIYANPGYQNNVPGYGMYYNPYMMQQQQMQDRIINVPGFRLSQNPLITQQDIDQVQKLYMEMNDEIDEAEEKGEFQTPYNYNGYYGYNSNYNWGGWNTYSIQQKYNSQVQEILDRAEQRRLDWEKRLLRTCHHYLNDGVTDEESDKSLDGYQIRIPGAQVQDDYLYDYLCTARPVQPYDNPWAQNFFELQYQYRMMVPDTDNMNEFFRDLNKVRIYEEFIDETSRRRDPNRVYDSASYRALIRKAKRSRDASGISLNGDKSQTLIDLMAQPKGTVSQEQIEHSILSDMGIDKLAHFENGTLTLNDPPDWVGKRPIVDEEMANVHVKDRDAFLKSIYTKDGGG